MITLEHKSTIRSIRCLYRVIMSTYVKRTIALINDKYIYFFKLL